MNSYGYNPSFVPREKPTLERPGKHEALTLVALFASGSCVIASTIFPYAFAGAVPLMSLGLVGLWRSRSWSVNTKAFSTVFLLLFYAALAMVAALIVTSIEPPALGVLFRLGVLGAVFGVPAGIAAWFALLFLAVRGRAEARSRESRLAAT
ncbi:MAG: hypothetical protein ACRDKE_11635 [Solirubrobacterales bacterium]